MVRSYFHFSIAKLFKYQNFQFIVLKYFLPLPTTPISPDQLEVGTAASLYSTSIIQFCEEFLVHVRSGESWNGQAHFVIPSFKQ